MSTIQHILDPALPWKQITLGTEQQPVLIQVISGGMFFCGSEVRPTDDAPAHYMISGPQSFLTVTAPTILWVKGSKELSRNIIVVTGRDAIE